MATDTKIDELVINVLTKSQYDTLTKDDNQLYLVSDDEGTDYKLYRKTIIINGTIGDNTYWLYMTIHSKDTNEITSVQTLQDILTDSSGSIAQPINGYIKTASGGIYMLYLLTTNMKIIGINSSGETARGNLSDGEVNSFRTVVVEVL